MRLIPLFVVLGCQDTELVIGTDLVGCSDYQTDDPPPEELVVEATDLLVEVFRDGVIQYCDSDFTPDIGAEDGVIVVREYWTETENEDCTTCFNPTIQLKDPGKGSYDVEWYIGDDPIAFGTIQFEVD